MFDLEESYTRFALETHKGRNKKKYSRLFTLLEAYKMIPVKS